MELHQMTRVPTKELSAPGCLPLLRDCKRQATQHLPVQSKKRVQRSNKHILHTISPPREASYSVSHKTTREDDKEAFDWYHNWYPVTPVSYLDPTRPHPITLLGNNLVLWKDESGNWSCLEDACSHRLVRLSEGRIEPKTGNLMCSYHGWQFNGQGQCTSIPQTQFVEAEQKMCANSKSCVKKFPVREAIGLLWVWPKSGPTASLEAATKSLNIPPGWDTEPDQYLPLKHWFMRDVPYSWDMLVENVVDPSHVAFAHHGVQGNREKPMISKMSVDRPMTLPGGFTVMAQPINKAAAKVGSAGRTDAAPASENAKADDNSRGPGNTALAARHGKSEGEKGPPPTLIHFKPPDYTLYEIMGGRVNMVNYAIPTSPGTARILHKVLGDKRKLALSGWKLAIASFKPDLLVCKDHMENNAVIDGDGVFLHLQEQDQAKGASWRDGYYTPTSMDRAVIAFRGWWEKAGALIPWAEGTRPGMSSKPSREEMLDRWNSHTKFCPTCQKALRQLLTVQRAATLVAGLSLLAVAGLAGASLAGSNSAPQAWKIVASAAGAALLAYVSVWLEQWKKYFYFKDYVHSEH